MDETKSSLEDKVISCTRRIQFCAGHRVMGHENKCAHVHGHNYIAHITATAEQLDTIGRVVDFSVLKQVVGGWIEREWDHGFIVNSIDREIREVLERFQPRAGQTQKLFLLPGNPTAEVLAEYLLRVVAPRELEGSGVRVIRVELWETENCRAEACA